MLSNSYSAEYGGLAGVVVTTKRGSLQYRGTGFYDFNTNGLNALTYNQTLSGVSRDDPNSDTHEHRWGASLGGPLFGNKLFFYGNYEGSNDKAIYGGGRSNAIPTQAMRAGDFRGTSIHPKDPLTGEPFPDQVIPTERIDPSATKIMNFFYPLPNQGTTRRPGTESSSSSCPRRASASGSTSGSIPRRRRTTRSSCAEATSTATPATSRSRRATLSRTCPSSTRSSTPLR